MTKIIKQIARLMLQLKCQWIQMFNNVSLTMIMNHEFHNYWCGSVLISWFSSATSLMKSFAQKLNKYKYKFAMGRWRYGSVEMSDKTGPHLTLIDCKPQRPLWIPKSENWFSNEDSSLKILVFALHHRIKTISNTPRIAMSVWTFGGIELWRSRHAPVRAMIYCLGTGKISCFVTQ